MSHSQSRMALEPEGVKMKGTVPSSLIFFVAHNVSRIKEVRRYANFEKSLISLVSAVIRSE